MQVNTEFIDVSKVPDPLRSREAVAGEPSKRCGGLLHKGGVYLTVDSFYANKRRYDGLASVCKDCEKYWLRVNPESRKDIIARYRRKKHGADALKAAPGFRDRLGEYLDSGEYTGPDPEAAAERLLRYEQGEEYRK
jgi:hypothetical protein